jgi:class 3 adenylate cyclase
LSEHVGEEHLFAPMNELYELFTHNAHRHEGTVNRLTGEGMMAFLGAPLAVEQAPLRAIRIKCLSVPSSRRCDHFC